MSWYFWHALAGWDAPGMGLALKVLVTLVYVLVALALAFGGRRDGLVVVVVFF